MSLHAAALSAPLQSDELCLVSPGLSLQCYSCPDGPSNSCETNAVSLTLPSEKTYSRCLRYTDCDFMTLAVRYSLADFDFDCCQSKLCNGPKKTPKPLLDQPHLTPSASNTDSWAVVQMHLQHMRLSTNSKSHMLT
uniref:MAC-inhibitory protein n=1 Tax=Cyclopterus lumpus TaxID=8103 RepID=A0A8C2WFM7_CYCLU